MRMSGKPCTWENARERAVGRFLEEVETRGQWQPTGWREAAQHWEIHQTPTLIRPPGGSFGSPGGPAPGTVMASRSWGGPGAAKSGARVVHNFVLKCALRDRSWTNTGATLRARRVSGRWLDDRRIDRVEDGEGMAIPQGYADERLKLAAVPGGSRRASAWCASTTRPRPLANSDSR